MEIKEFIQNFADQFEEIEASLITPPLRFRELDEWSSLAALTVIAMIDDEYDVQLTSDEMRKAQTIQELFDIVNLKSLK